jgi:UDP-N-acetylglucosamine 2-epimerase (non-hydrolysing)
LTLVVVVSTLKTMTLRFILGTAAELIKMYPLIKEAEAQDIPWVVISTGQSPIGFRHQWEDFKLPLNRLVSAVATEKDLGTSRAAMKWFLRAWFANPKNWFQKSRAALADSTKGCDFYLVHGDTLSTLVGTKWGSKLKGDVVHVEAGLRSSHLFSPFPEEINRRLVSRRARLHMAPNSWAADNLRAAGIHKGVMNTGGNTLSDAVRLFATAAAPTTAKPYVMVNVHRFENLNSATKWRFIAETLKKAAVKYELRMVMHPQTREKLNADSRLKTELEVMGVKLLERMRFSEFINQLANSEYVISDGGSNQEECYYLGKPCLLLRAETERQEGLNGPCVLTKFNWATTNAFLENPKSYARKPAWPEESPSQLILKELHRVEKVSSV